MKKTQIKTGRVLGILLTMVWAITACSASEVESGLAMKVLSCKLQAKVSTAEEPEVVVTFTLKNQTETALEVLQYHTPLEDLIGPVFELRFGDEILPYQGPMVKRMPPTDEDWLLIKPAASLSNELDISLAWDLSRKGQYSLRLNQGVEYRESGKTDVQSMPADHCPAVTFQIK